MPDLTRTLLAAAHGFVRLRNCALFLSLLLVPGAASSIADTPPNREEPHHLSAFTPLVGPAWVAEFPDGGLTDTQRFEWMFGGKFLRNVHHVTDAAGRIVYEGETIYAWNQETRSLLWWYFNTTGGYVIGEAAVDGNVVSFTGVNHGSADQTKKVKGQIEIVDGGFASTSFFWNDGQWNERFTMHFSPDDDASRR